MGLVVVASNVYVDRAVLLCEAHFGGDHSISGSFFFYGVRMRRMGRVPSIQNSVVGRVQVTLVFARYILCESNVATSASQAPDFLGRDFTSPFTPSVPRRQACSSA